MYQLRYWDFNILECRKVFVFDIPFVSEAVSLREGIMTSKTLGGEMKYFMSGFGSIEKLNKMKKDPISNEVR